MKKFLTLLFTLTSTPLFAFYLNTNINAGFGKNTVSVSVTSNSTCTQAGVSKELLLELAVEGAKKYWNRVPTSKLRITNGGFYQTTDSKFLTEKICAEDSNTTCDPSTTVPKVTNIVIACNSNTTDNFTSGALLALSAPTKVSSTEIQGSIILINDSANTQFKNLSRAEMVSVLAHEIGHAIGLGHTDKKEALMYHLNSENRNRLAQDDVDGVTYLYPNKLNGCTTMFGTINTKKNFFPPNDKGPMTKSKNNSSTFLKSMGVGLLFILLIKFFLKFITLQYRGIRQS